MPPRIPTHHWPKIFLLLPAGILALYFHFNPFNFHSDDLGHWLAGLEWGRLFAEKPFFRALLEMLQAPRPHPSFHPLLGSIIFGITGSVPLATRLIGLVFITIVSVSCYAILKQQAIKEKHAVLGALAVCTYPYLLGIGRSFMAELPFCGFALAAVACLFRGRYWAFSLLYCLTILERPPEGLVLVPSMILFYFLSAQCARQKAHRRFIIALLSALAIAGFALSFRLQQLQSWLRFTFHTGPEKQVSANEIHFGWENLRYVAQSIYTAFGPFGMALLGFAAFTLCRQRKEERTRAASFLGIFLSIALFLAALSTFQNYSALGMFGRFTLALVCLQILFASAILLREKSKVGLCVVAAFFLTNFIFCLFVVTGPESRHRLGQGLYTSHGYWAFHYRASREDAEAIAQGLKEILPAKGKSYVMLVGHDWNMIGLPENTGLRLLGEREVRMERRWPAVYQREIFRLKILEGKVRLRDFQIDAVIFEKNADTASDELFPNARINEILRARQPEQLGLELTRTVRWLEGLSQKEVEIYRVL